MFCHLVVLVGLSVSVQVINWKDSSLEMTYNVLMGTLNSTHSLWIHYSDEYDEALQFIIAHYSAPKRIYGPTPVALPWLPPASQLITAAI